MKFLSKNGLILSAAVLFMGIASANKADNDADAIATNIPTDSKTYTASGTTDLKTAQMLVNLLRNPHLKVKAVIHPAIKDSIQIPKNASDRVYTTHGKTDLKTAQMLINLLRNPYLKVKAEVHPAVRKEADYYYTIKGRTTIENVNKLKALLQNNKQINITVQANNKKAGSPIRLNAEAQPAQQYIYQDYVALIAKGQPFYHYGRPPVFIQGNTLWYPVAVTTQAPSEQTTQKVQKVSE